MNKLSVRSRVSLRQSSCPDRSEERARGHAGRDPGTEQPRTPTAGHRRSAGSPVSMSSNPGTGQLALQPVRICGRLFLK